MALSSMTVAGLRLGTKCRQQLRSGKVLHGVVEEIVPRQAPKPWSFVIAVSDGSKKRMTVRRSTNCTTWTFCGEPDILDPEMVLVQSWARTFRGAPPKVIGSLSCAPHLITKKKMSPIYISGKFWHELNLHEQRGDVEAFNLTLFYARMNGIVTIPTWGYFGKVMVPAARRLGMPIYEEEHYDG
jgi:uncharacterized protein YwbE